MNVVFICTGNICRSPFAEYAAKKIAEERGLSSWTFSSQGIQALVGKAADKVGSKVSLDSFDVDMAPHKAEQVSIEHLSRADLILCMDKSHKAYLDMQFPSFSDVIHLFAQYPKKSGLFSSSEVADPYKRGEASFEKSYKIITKQLKLLIHD